MLVIICVSSAYACSMKGDGLFSFRFSNFQLFEDRELFIEWNLSFDWELDWDLELSIHLIYACVRVPACTDRSAYVYYNVHLH